MPSNKELKADIEALSAELDIAVETDGLKNDELVALLSDLRAKLKDAETETVADLAKPAAGYTVAPGKALVTLVGVIAEGKPVTAKHFSGGDKQLKELVAKGYII